MIAIVVALRDHAIAVASFLQCAFACAREVFAALSQTSGKQAMKVKLHGRLVAVLASLAQPDRWVMLGSAPAFQASA